MFFSRDNEGIKESASDLKVMAGFEMGAIVGSATKKNENTLDTCVSAVRCGIWFT